jgi:hypothetical protein
MKGRKDGKNDTGAQQKREDDLDPNRQTQFTILDPHSNHGRWVGQIEEASHIAVHQSESMLINLLSDFLEEGHGRQGCAVPTSNHEVGQYQQKGTIVVVPNAIVDPGTVMIHLKDASLAGGAVMTSRGSKVLTLFAKAPGDWWVDVFILAIVVRWNIILTLHNTRKSLTTIEGGSLLFICRIQRCIPPKESTLTLYGMPRSRSCRCKHHAW